MIEPVTLLVTFVTLWAQLNNYGIDVEANEHLRNIRVRRDIYALTNKEQNVHKDLRNSLILNSINNGRWEENQPYKLQQKNEEADKFISILRAKRSYRTNYHGNNNHQTTYVEGKVPLANYSRESPYYSQNTDGVPYYYTSYNYNIGNGYNNVDNGNNNPGNGNKLSNQHKTSGNVHVQSSIIKQHSNANIYNDLATTGKSNGNIIKRMSQYVMPSNSLNNITNNGYQYRNRTTVTSNSYQNYNQSINFNIYPSNSLNNNTNNGYQYSNRTTVTSNSYQNYNQGINNSYQNRNTTQGIDPGSRQFYKPYGYQNYGYNQTNGYTYTTQHTNNGYGINNAGNGYSNGINSYNNAGNGNNNSGIWNYNTGFVNNTRYANYNTGYMNNNTGIWNNNLGSVNNSGNWNYNGSIYNNAGNLNYYAGNLNNNAGNFTNNAGNFINNVVNGTINASNGNNNTEKVQQSYFMSGVGCPEFFKSVTIFGKKMCLEDIDY